MHRRGASNEYPQHMFSSSNRKTINLIPTLIQTYAFFQKRDKTIFTECLLWHCIHSPKTVGRFWSGYTTCTGWWSGVTAGLGVSVICAFGDQEVTGFDPRQVRQHSFMEVDHEIFSMVILSLPLISEGLLVSCLRNNVYKYWFSPQRTKPAQ